MNLKPCKFCGFAFDVDLLGVPGCPNCAGDGFRTPLTVAERQAKATDKKRRAGLVRLQIWVTPETSAKIKEFIKNDGI